MKFFSSGSRNRPPVTHPSGSLCAHACASACVRPNKRMCRFPLSDSVLRKISPSHPSVFQQVSAIPWKKSGKKSPIFLPFREKCLLLQPLSRAEGLTELKSCRYGCIPGMSEYLTLHGARERERSPAFTGKIFLKKLRKKFGG